MRIFDFNRDGTGSFIDSVSKTAGTPAGGWSWARTEKGLAWEGNGTNTKIQFPSTVNMGTVGSIIISFRILTKPTGADHDKVLALSTDVNYYVSFRATNEIYIVINGEAENVPWILNNKWNLLVITRSGADIEYFINNISLGTDILVAQADTDYLFDTIGNYGTSYFNGNVQEIEVYNKVLTAQERAKAYERFLKASPRGVELYPKPVIPERKPTDLSRYVDTGLCLAHNMIPSSGNLLVDTSNQNAPGAIDGATEILEGLSFDGKDDSVAINLSLALAATIKTICFRIKLASTTEMILDGDNTGSLVIDANAGTLQYPAYDNAFIDGVDTDTIFADQWTDVVITSSTAVDNNTPTLGRTTAAAFTYGKFEIADLQYWSKEFTLQDAEDYHNSFVKPVLNTIPSVYDPVGSTWPFGCVKGTGSFVVDELTAQDAVLKELDVGTKFNRVTGAGLISVPTKQAYGTWEGFIYKGDTANRLYMILIANKIGVAGYVQGYALNFDNDEGIYLEKYDGVGGTTVLFATAASYITINTWYKYRFTRTLDGVMTLLLKGGALIPTAGYDGWTLAAPTGAYVNPTVADNTYTTCEYLVVDGGVLDRAIIDHTDNGVKQ